jgi:N-acetylglutamate synthase-like GNAT family acetyltransferase
MMMPDIVSLRPAVAADLPAVSALLRDAGLPVDGLDDQFGPAYVVAVEGDAIVGAEGIERYGRAGLLRSAVVSRAWRGRGLGDRLTRDRLSWASEQQLREVWLLTTTAGDYFPRFGFATANRSDAPAELQESPEFKTACPATATAMRLIL